MTKHPHRAIILLTYAYLSNDGARFNGTTQYAGSRNYPVFNSSAGANNGEDLWQFMPDGKTVRVRDYSPLLDQTSTAADCAFEFTLNPS